MLRRCASERDSESGQPNGQFDVVLLSLFPRGSREGEGCLVVEKRKKKKCPLREHKRSDKMQKFGISNMKTEVILGWS